MSTKSTTPTRRDFLAASVVTGVASVLPPLVVPAGDAFSQSSNKGGSQMAMKDEISSFSFHAPEAELADLRKRINATKWPEREQVTDDSQGVRLATAQKLARYWATEHDWRKIEARLNAQIGRAHV